MDTKINNALISVSDKTGIVDFAKKLSGMGVKIISTGGTAKQLFDILLPMNILSPSSENSRCSARLA